MFVAWPVYVAFVGATRDTREPVTVEEEDKTCLAVFEGLEQWPPFESKFPAAAGAVLEAFDGPALRALVNGERFSYLVINPVDPSSALKQLHSYEELARFIVADGGELK